MNHQLCPCCSHQRYSQCCSPFLDAQKIPATAEQLMRSRYTAYVKHDVNYLLNSWHHATRPVNLDVNELVKLNWLQLYIVKSKLGSISETFDYVEFIAYFSQNNTVQKLHEISQFTKVQRVWYYFDGEIMTNSNFQPGRNSLCYCGSGKKYKKCCLTK